MNPTTRTTTAPGQQPQQPRYLLVLLACGCTVMQLQASNSGLFWLLQNRLTDWPIMLYCPEHRRQPARREVTRTQRRPHWPVIEEIPCSSCRRKMSAPPPPVQGDEPTMLNELESPANRHAVYIQCPDCRRWGMYSFVGSAEDRYDVLWKKVDCPECSQPTLISYNVFTVQTGETARFTCLTCRRPFGMVFTARE